MDIDAQFPALSALAQENGRSLKELSKTAPVDNRFLGLNGFCWWVLNDQSISTYKAAGPSSYLVTLNEFLKRLPSHAGIRQKIWRKLTNGSQSASLDTVVEVAWALYFWNHGYHTKLEEPFDCTDPCSKDADIVVTIGNKTFWLDAINVELSDGSIVDNLAKRAIKKYKAKFDKAVSSGLLQNSSVGILLCILKSEWRIPALGLAQPSPPAKLFTDGSLGLEVVCIHTLHPDPISGLLWPSPILKWTRQKI